MKRRRNREHRRTKKAMKVRNRQNGDISTMKVRSSKRQSNESEHSSKRRGKESEEQTAEEAMKGQRIISPLHRFVS